MSVLDDIEAAVFRAAPGLLTQAARYVAAVAQSKAPVRKIFGGDTRIIRTKSIEDAQTISNRVVVGHTIRYPHQISQRRLVEQGPPGEVVGQDLLDRRGRYEVASGRADYRARGRARQVGGRLKGEIRATPARVEGRLVVAEVISPTPYAKFQEFGTRHNPAHPFLRPAAAESRPVVASEVRAGLLEAARGATRGSGGRVAAIKVKLVAEVK
jgi:HK97 gp10 family phage protein